MNYIVELQKALDYIEDNLEQDINYEKIVKDYTRCILGVCVGANNAKEYKYGIGIEMQENDEQVPGTEIINVAKSKWVIFKGEGNKAEAINELWSKIYKEYFVTSEYKQSMNIDFELYDEKDTEIWIPIC